MRTLTTSPHIIYIFYSFDHSSYYILYKCCSNHGDYVKSLIFGGLDGIITTFAIVAAVAGSDMDPDVVILMGIANLMADGISMGLGDYLSETAEINFVQKEREREMWYVCTSVHFCISLLSQLTLALE